MDESPHYLSLAEAGEELPGKRSAASVRNLIVKGANGIKLQAVYDGKRYWTTKQWVAEYLQAQSERVGLLSAQPKPRFLPWEMVRDF